MMAVIAMQEDWTAPGRNARCKVAAALVMASAPASVNASAVDRTCQCLIILLQAAQRRPWVVRSEHAPEPEGGLCGSSGGHAVKFEAKGTNWFLTDVRIFGARYGSFWAPKENFHVWACDDHLNPIADFPFPYSSFARGRERWVSLKTRPCRVPQQFAICVGFNATGSKGVYVSHDKTGSGRSLTALPGRNAAPFTKGDWLIRARLDERNIRR